MRPLPFAAAAVGACLLLAACGSGTGSDAVAGSGAVTSAGSTAPFAGKTPEQILAAANTAAQAASSVHVKGAVTSDGETIKLDMVLTGAGAADGQLGVDGETIKLRQVGQTSYIQANDTFWTSQGLGAATTLLSGKWLKVPSSTPGFSQYQSLTNLKMFFQGVIGPDTTAKLSLVPGKPSRGKQTVGLLDSGKDGGTLYVSTDEAKPLPMAILPLPSEATPGNKLTFSDWDAAVTIMDPAVAEMVDIAQLAALG